MRPVRRDISGRIRQDLLFRLRWNLLTSLDNVEIAVGPPGQTTYVSLFSHVLASEPLARPPLSCIDSVWIADYMDRGTGAYDRPEGTPSPAPPALTVSNEDGSPVTLGQFVTQVHAFLNQHMDEIKTSKSYSYGKAVMRDDGITSIEHVEGQAYLPEDIAFFFSHIYATSVDEAVHISVKVYADGESGRSAEDFWSVQSRQALGYGQQG